MPFVDYVKRLFGINDSPPQRNIPSIDIHLDKVDSQTLDIQPYQNPSVNDVFPDSNQFFEQEFQQLESFMRSLSIFGFPFGFGPSGPFQPPDPHHDQSSQFGGPSGPDSGMFPLPGFTRIFIGPGDFQSNIFGPTIEDPMEEESISPRDEVLKPSFRSSARDFKDEDYDDLVKEKGPEVILDLLKKSEESPQQRNDNILVPAPRREIAPRQSINRSFTSTKFSFVNGKSVQEQITSLSDGTYEKRITTTGPNGETNTVISQHTAEEVMPSFPRGGFDGGIFGGGIFGGGSGFGGPTLFR